VQRGQRVEAMENHKEEGSPMLFKTTTLSMLALFAFSNNLAAGETHSERMVREYLARANARNAMVTQIADPPVTNSLPGCACFAVRFQLYPVAKLPPEPLKASNVIVVRGYYVELITDAYELEKSVKWYLKSVQNDDDRKAAAVMWVRLSQELHQDGYFRFFIPEDEVTSGATTATAKAMVVPKGGNEGYIFVKLTFDEGKLIKVEEEANIKAGIRPRCQATKLLDPDPIVREMAEQDILVMGRSCEAYLDEQRAKASPELQQAIDRMWLRIVEEDP